MLGSQSDTLRSLQTLCRSDNTNSSSLSYAAGILIMTESPGAMSWKEISSHGSTAMCLLAVRIPALLILLFLWSITVLHVICIKIRSGEKKLYYTQASSSKNKELELNKQTKKAVWSKKRFCSSTLTEMPFALPEGKIAEMEDRKGRVSLLYFSNQNTSFLGNRDESNTKQFVASCLNTDWWLAGS